MLSAGLKGPLWIRALVLLFWLLDQVRGLFAINLGRFPRSIKLLYIRVLVYQHGYTYERDGYPAMNRAQRRAMYFRLPKRVRPFYVDLRGPRALPALAGGATTVASRSGLFWTQQKGSLPIIQDMKVFAGNIFFVDASTAQGGTSSGYGSHPDKALTTIDSAIDLCTASQGDAIFVLAGHTETVDAAGDIVLDKIGVAITGLGEGNNRPTITFSTDTLADIEVDAASCSIYNIRFIGNIAALAAPIDVDAAAFRMEDCDWYVATATTDIDITIITDANADDMEVRRCSFNYLMSRAATAVTNTSTEAIRLVGADRAVIEDCYFGGDFTTSAINGITTASGDIRIVHNYIHNIATEDIAGIVDLVAACNGVIAYNTGFFGLHDDASALATIIDPASCAMVENRFSNVVTEAGGLVGTAST